MLVAMRMVKNETTIQPTDITPGPPVRRPVSKRVVIPVMTDWNHDVSLISARERIAGPHDDGERNAKIMHKTPVTPQLLLISKLGQDALVCLLDSIGGPTSHGHSPLHAGLWFFSRQGRARFVTNWHGASIGELPASIRDAGKSKECMVGPRREVELLCACVCLGAISDTQLFVAVCKGQLA
jgi:hypothetical protein